ncbi:MAG: cupin domain-containing protein [Chloroflexi bacterium]|nr:cupin domain-containing protein [Chloroflexota bacterium]MBM3175263.1 cupin domain-containing protein [Chloroflexota bacterium]MBM4451156.1 cupin domain-containing protein [Chloroflexota bacterium]
MVPEITRNIGAAVRSARQSLNISIRELARRSGLSATAIWKIERGQMTPSVVVMVHIAHGLGMKLTELLDPVLEEENVVHTTRGSRVSGGANDLRDVAEIVSGASRSWIIQAAEHTLKKGAKSGRQPMEHSGEEMVYCLEGQVQYVIDGKTYNLKSGDSLHFKAQLPHTWQNVHNGSSRMLLVVVPPRGATRHAEPPN